MDYYGKSSQVEPRCEEGGGCVDILAVALTSAARLMGEICSTAQVPLLEGKGGKI